jgi:transposase
MVDVAHKSREEVIDIAVRLDEEITRLDLENIRLERENSMLRERYRLSQLKQYGSSSEKTITLEEAVTLFNEAEVLADPALPEPAVEEITYVRRKTIGKRDHDLEGLPTQIVDYTLPEDEQICPCCEGPLHQMSETVRKELKIVPAQVSVVHHKRAVYACRACQEDGFDVPVKTAPMPVPAFPNGIGSASAVAHIMTAKFADALPLYRQEAMLQRSGVSLSRQTMANWMIKGASYLDIIYDYLKENLLARDILHADETTLQVLREEGREAQTKSYLWLYRSGRDGPPIALFEYKQTRASQHPREFLRDFTGYLQVDAFPGYNHIPGVTIIGCLAHARRGFADVLKALSGQAQKSSVAAQGLAFCNRLYDIERELKDVSAEERKARRLERSTVVLEEFKTWLDAKSITTAPQSGVGKAVAYCINQWSKLNAFLLDGRLEIDNNRSERSIKPFVIGRKNWLFANSPAGAKASATIYSIVETAKENGLNPFEYLTYFFEQIPNVDKKDRTAIERLLPTSPDLPEYVRMKTK